MKLTSGPNEPPIAGADVRLPDYGLSTRSKTDGEFVFRDLFVLHPCTYTRLIVSAPGFGTTVNRHFILYPGGGHYEAEPDVELPGRGRVVHDTIAPAWDPHRTVCKTLWELHL